ncbi:DUF488 domain-containing protein [Pedomonas mirosovicensis]|uniref:DUF488 domain-containing protein n=1 Tax=Pedomonas mirosovicensis TaxID=2908641 RepID=UPI00216AAE28|nr:DUF488 domain-containing protein [Pedomonas mirosovicensis]MCH8685872.1 DUF488 domain-containing protein [Pedomonas mirosovicensis]
MDNVFTIGHSNISWGEFHYALELFDVGCILDVRSSPTSRWPQFRQHGLRDRLNRVGISYIHLGEHLGGHPKWGPTEYDARRHTTSFAIGIESILSVAARCRPALMCSEADPLRCHRFLLISRHLNALPNVDVRHIRHNGTLEGHIQAEDRLLALHRMSQDLLTNREELLAEAYARQERKLA